MPSLAFGYAISPSPSESGVPRKVRDHVLLVQAVVIPLRQVRLPGAVLVVRVADEAVPVAQGVLVAAELPTPGEEVLARPRAVRVLQPEIREAKIGEFGVGCPDSVGTVAKKGGTWKKQRGPSRAAQLVAACHHVRFRLPPVV